MFHESDEGQRFIVLNDNPDKLSGYPPGYIIPYRDDEGPFYFPIEDTGKQLNWKKNWTPPSYKKTILLVVFLLMLYVFRQYFAVGFVLFVAYVRYVYIHVYPRFKELLLPVFRRKTLVASETFFDVNVNDVDVNDKFDSLVIEGGESTT